MRIPTVLTRRVKALSASQPFNVMATTLARMLTQAVGDPPEWLIRRLPRIGTVSASLPNGQILKMISQGDDPIPTRLYWLGLEGYEPETTRVFMQLARLATVVLDIGAYTGYFALLAALCNPTAEVYAFEPLPELCVRIRQNVQLNHVVNMTCVPCAVGKQDESARFFRGGNAMPSCSSLSQEFALANCMVVREVNVPVVRLDTWVASAGLTTVDLLKIDTESTEPDVLAGMPQLLKESRPHIICEVFREHTAPALEAVLSPWGYRYYVLTADGPRPCAHIAADPKWRNQLFSVADPMNILGDQRW